MENSTTEVHFDPLKRFKGGELQPQITAMKRAENLEGIQDKAGCVPLPEVEASSDFGQGDVLVISKKPDGNDELQPVSEWTHCKLASKTMPTRMPERMPTRMQTRMQTMKRMWKPRAYKLKRHEKSNGDICFITRVPLRITPGPYFLTMFQGKRWASQILDVTIRKGKKQQ